MSFNWHQSDGFLRWMIPHLVGGKNRDLFDQLSEATDKFTNVTLTIKINDIEVDTEMFVDSVRRNMDYITQDAAKKMVEKPLEGLVPELEALQDAVRQAENAIRDHVKQKLKEAGIDLNFDDYDY